MVTLDEFETWAIQEIDQRVYRRRIVDRKGKVTRQLLRVMIWNWSPVMTGEPEITRDFLKQVKRQYKATYGFDPLTLFIIQIIIKIAVEIFLHWWKNRPDREVLAGLQQQCVQFNIQG